MSAPLLNRIVMVVSVGLAWWTASAALGAGEVAPLPPVSAPASMALAPTAAAPAATPTAPAEAAAAPTSWPPGLLMDGLGTVGLKKPLEDLNLRVWGFVEGGFTGRLSGGQNPLPLMGLNATRPNNLLLHQLRLTVERPYDNSKPLDLGFRVDGLYGSDAMLTRSAGLFDHAGSGTGSNWGDITQMYIQPWIKTGPESGLEITAGKFISPMGFEVTDAPSSPLFSHSYLFTFASPVSHTGVKLNYIFNPQVSVYVGAMEGWDVFEDNNDAWSTMIGGALNSAEQIDGHHRTTLGLTVMAGPEQAGNVSHQRTAIDAYLTHWWTSQFSETVEANYGVEQGVPGVGAAHWYGAANYLMYVINDNLSATWRAEWFRDDGGARTGFSANYYENTWGVTITPAPKDPVWKNLLLRPELRWDIADQPAFGGGRDYQLTLGFDVIFKF